MVWRVKKSNIKRNASLLMVSAALLLLVVLSRRATPLGQVLVNTRRVLRDVGGVSPSWP